jgi:hypothetical protein
VTPAEREALVEEASGAFRERDADGFVKPHPAWFDLDAEGRLEAFEAAMIARRLEAAIDAGGLSTTAKAVLARIRG